MAANRSNSVRALVLAAVALVIGLVLGGLGPRSEARDLRARIEQLEEQATKCRSGLGQQLTQVFRGRPWDNEIDPADQQFDRELWEGEGAGPRTKVERSDQGWDVTVEGEDEADGADFESIDAVRDAMELRRTQARQALLEKAGPDDVQLATIDSAVASMNEELRMIAEELVTAIGDKQEPSRREMMVFASDTLEVLIDTEDQITDALDDDQLDDVDEESLDPLSYIDPSLIEYFAELDQGGFGGGPPAGDEGGVQFQLEIGE